MSLNPEQIERLKAAFAQQLEERKISAAWYLETHKAHLATQLTLRTAAVGYANAAMKGLLLLNGGAVVVMLALVGNVVKGASSPVRGLDVVFEQLGFFIVGLCASVAAMGLSYISQTCLTEPESEAVRWWVGGGLRVLAVVVACASLVAFTYGAYGTVGAVGV